MKTLELEQFGVCEMNAKEMKETDGGSWLTELIHIILSGGEPQV